MPQKHLNHLWRDACCLLLELCNLFVCLQLKALDVRTGVAASLKSGNDKNINKQTDTLLLSYIKKKLKGHIMYCTYLCKLPLEISFHLCTVLGYFSLSLFFCLPKPCRFSYQRHHISVYIDKREFFNFSLHIMEHILPIYQIKATAYFTLFSRLVAVGKYVNYNSPKQWN